MINKIKYTLIILLLAVLPSIKGQTTAPEASLDSTLLLIGDQVKLDLKLEIGRGTQVLFPMFGDTLIKGVEVLNSSLVDTVFLKSGRMILSQRHVITSFDTGMYVIPRLPIFVKEGSKVDTLFSNMLAMKVVTLKVDTAKAIFDIKPPIQKPLVFSEIAVPVFGILLALLIIAIGIFVYIRYKKNKPIFKREKPKEPAHIIAYRELNILKQEKLWQQGELKEYYTRLTDIFRIYIENRFSVYALEQTSDQIINSLVNLNEFDKKTINKIKDLLFWSDLAKFAKAVPGPDDNIINYKTVKEFVDNTRLIIEDQKDSNTESSESIINEELIDRKEVNNE